LKNYHFPLVVVGAGPAGSTASLYLSEQQIPHLLVDKAVFPRDKICGDAVSNYMLNVIGRLRPHLMQEFASQPERAVCTYGMQFVAPNGRSVDIPFPPPRNNFPIGLVARRREFDSFLFGLTAGPYATVWQGVQVQEAVYRKNEVELTMALAGEQVKVSTPLVIAADGSRSVVKKHLLGEDMEPAYFSGGIRAYYRGVTGLHPQNFLELHFYKSLLPGYLWIFPLPGGYANVGLGMLSSHISKRRVNLRQELTRLIREEPALRHRFAGATLEGSVSGWGLPLGSRQRPLSGPHVLLTGDAASLIDPFSGEGVGNAGLSGMAAAQVALQALEKQDYSPQMLAAYDALVYQKIGKQLRLSYSLQQLSTYPWLFSFVVNRVSSSSTLQEVFSNMFYDLDLRAKMKNPLFYLKLLLGK
jgi:geranylgeranyl reductase family protein